MEVANLNVKVREDLGRKRVERLRNEGLVPAVLYGLGRDTVSLTLPGKEFLKHVFAHHKLFELSLDGADSNQAAYLQEMQWNNLTDELLHADFLRIDMTKPMKTSVDIVYVGVSKGSMRNGVFESPLSHLEIECLPTDLPESIRIVINDLDVDDQLYVKDLPVPEGITILTDAETMACQVKTKVEEVEETEEAEEGEATPEGEDTPAAE
jgi:large subunit ribosomal protein L25